MAAVFLVMLYEYSPLFYVSVVSLCFVVTAAMVLGWFGFDVPVILRNSDETESVLPTPEKQMVQVTNPFALEVGSGPASVTSGVSVRPCCLEPCVLTCFWGCEVAALQGALQAHQHGPRLDTPQRFQDALRHRYCYSQSFQINTDDQEERSTQIPPDQGVTHFGPLPRDRYPLVALLTLTDEQTRDNFNIVSSVTVVHVPDQSYPLSARVLFQYLLTAQGSMYELKPLFMSADSRGESSPPGPDHSTPPTKANKEDGPQEEGSKEEPSPALESEEDQDQDQEEQDQSQRRRRDCVVCQNAAVNRVLLPCRHACVCHSCVAHFQHCPMCRAFIIESFALSEGGAAQH
ncbi:cell growth regulator with RING finger domain protein 1 [Sphaeramia orbicularis]|uniref:Cell growth regulator with RING finger domain protein 1 n=1 Tax=Sphaeramia orbicularis TaxID=375764 RepID=A0A672ZBQ0_9TELE|nr:cell growth regulator with RING finger domain protein 1 [Sphaeramia orbicularis]